MGSRVAATLCVLALACARGVTAQETINRATLSGRVTDAQGGVVPGAVVSARQLDTNIVSVAAADGEGRFRFAYLQVGPYEVVVRLDGFAEFTREITLTIGSAFDIPISLDVAGIAANVTVTGQAPMLETSRTQIAGTVLTAEVKDMPLNGRNVLDLALLVPGVSPTNIGSTQLFAETSAVPGQGISIGSQRNFSNNFIVDGLSANDDAAGLAGMPYGVDAVDQFQVVTSGGQAELGRALGGYINVVTKSGTNSSRGGLYGFFRDARFNDANALSGATLPMDQQQYGASLGGPIFRNRTFYFANVEQRTLNQTGLVTIAQDAVDAINARLAAVGYAGSRISTGIYPNPISTTSLLGKLDHHAGGRNQMSVRYSLYRADADNARGAGGTTAPSASSNLDNVDQGIAFANTLTLSPRTVNETRAQFVHSDLEAPPSDTTGPAVSIAGVASFGRLSSSPTRRTNRMYQVVDNISHQRGAHALRAGVDFLFNDDAITFPRAVRGTYTFASLAAFQSGVYNNVGFTQTFGAIGVSQTNPNLGIYLQDEWRAGSNVTVNAGLRYDLQFLETIRTDADNVAPRVGVAWTPFGSPDTVVRASAGLFYDRIPLRALANALLSAGNTTDPAAIRQNSVSVSPAQAGAPSFPNILNEAIPTVTLVNFTTMDRGIQNAHSRQASVEVERRAGRFGTYSVGYQYVSGRDLIIAINQNVPACVAVGANNGCRPDPSYANNNQYSSSAASNYHGLHLSFVQRPAAWGNVRVSYTLSKSMNNVGENFFSSPIDPFDLSKDWSRSDDDQRHRLVVSGAINSPMTPADGLWEQLTHGFRMSAMLQTYSALPFNITSGVTTVQGTPGRPVVDGAFIPRNAGVGGDFFSLGLRVSRTFRMSGSARVEGIVEAFNITNHRNNLTRIGNFGSGAYPLNPAPTFNQITAVGDPRSVQLGIRVSF